MANVLSQVEIDQLLNAISTGEVDVEEMQEEAEKNKVKTYDFKRPNKLSKDHISMLHMIHENYARIISNYLTGQLRQSVMVSVGSVEQLAYEEFVRSVPIPTILCTLNVAELGGKFFMEVNPAFAYQVIDLLLGGAAKETDRSNRFTDIELEVVGEVLETMSRCMRFAWEEVVDMNAVIESVDKSLQMEQSVPPNEAVAMISLRTDLMGKQSFINLCLPYYALEPVVDHLSIHNWFEGDKNRNDGETYTQILEHKLRTAQAEMEAELGRTQLTVGDFIQLDQGDVIRLDRKVTEPLDLFVEGKLKFKGSLGISKKMMAVQILDIVEEDVTLDE